MDPFAGVASTGIAAALEGRRFFGCEIAAHYALLAHQRYSEFLAGTLQIRDWQRPIDAPNPRQSVAKVPKHFWRHENGSPISLSERSKAR
jgi:adenine-specific DNA-methyltransferase